MLASAGVVALGGQRSAVEKMELRLVSFLSSFCFLCVFLVKRGTQSEENSCFFWVKCSAGFPLEFLRFWFKTTH